MYCSVGVIHMNVCIATLLACEFDICKLPDKPFADMQTYDNLQIHNETCV